MQLKKACENGDAAVLKSCLRANPGLDIDALEDEVCVCVCVCVCVFIYIIYICIYIYRGRCRRRSSIWRRRVGFVSS